MRLEKQGYGMKYMISGGAGLALARFELQGANAARVRRALPVQPANINAALGATTRARGQHAHGGLANGTYAAVGKRLLDVSLVLLSLPVVLPIIALCALALWIESGRPFYTQPRLGRAGRTFRILKLRTMVRDADQLLQQYLREDPALRQEWEQTQKLKNDPRIPRVGRLLRATSLVELPQLWNVLTGDMSLVGPRPMMPNQLGLYGDAQAYFALRPGITGVWQVSVRNEAGFSCRAQADSQYLREVTLQRDVGLIWRTLAVVVKGTGY